MRVALLNMNSDELTNGPTDQRTHHRTHQRTNGPTHQPTNGPTHQLINGATDQTHPILLGVSSLLFSVDDIGLLRTLGALQDLLAGRLLITRRLER